MSLSGTQSPSAQPLGAPGQPEARRLGPLEILLVCWVAMFPLDRLDFLGGQAGFVLTPHIALTPLVAVVWALARLGRGRRVALPAGLGWFTAFLLALVGVIAISGVFGIDPVMSARRSLQLVLVSVGVLPMVAILLNEERPRRLLALGGELGLGLMLLTSLASARALLTGRALTVSLGPAALSLEPETYGAVPRFSGAVGDPNWGGLVLLFFLFLVAAFGRPGLRRQLWIVAGVGMVLATLSRSAVLGGMLMIVTGWLMQRPLRVSRTGVFVGAVALGLAMLLFMVRPESARVVGETLAPVSGRVSVTEGSTSDHFLLMRRGIDEGTHSIRRAALGIGYGNSNRLLQDMFRESTYGNFHSVYVTLLVESGVVSLLLFLVMLGYPLVRQGPYLPMAAGLAGFNVFYQSISGPVLWLVLALAWSTHRGPRG